MLFASSTYAAESPPEGVIMKSGGGEVVVDVGRDEGLSPGDEVWVYRRLVVTHPVSGQDVEDRFPIGTLRLEQVGEQLSIARDWSKLSRKPKPGDFVVVEPRVIAAKKAPKPESEPAPESTDERPAERAVDEVFEETLGRSIPDRIAAWQKYLVDNPDSPWAEQVQNELHWLRVTLSQQRAREKAMESRPSAPQEPPSVEADAVAPAAIHAGMPVAIDATVRDPDRVDRVRLHVRREGEPTYETIQMSPVGDYNWTTELDPAEWSSPGRLEYFAEVIRDDGQLERIEPAGGRPDIQVREAPEDPVEAGGRSKASMVAEYVDFKAGEGRDEFTRFEAEYRYSLQIPLLRAFSAGVGVFRGTGASIEGVEAGESRSMLVNYGFAETELEFWPFIGLNTRLLVGNNQRLGVSDSVFEEAFGASGELRFGQAEGTKLLVGAAFTRTVGAEAWITLDIEAIENVPMSGEVIVTNLPVGEDLGVSLNYGAGYAFTDWFTLMGRVGWNARTITHHGPTAGLSTVFNW
jgi:hypothetical protein